MNQTTAAFKMRKPGRLSSYPTAQPGGEAAGSQLAKREAGANRRSGQLLGTQALSQTIEELTLDEVQAGVRQPLQSEGEAAGREPSKTKVEMQEHSPDAHKEEERDGAE